MSILIQDIQTKSIMIIKFNIKKKPQYYSIGTEKTLADRLVTRLINYKIQNTAKSMQRVKEIQILDFSIRNDETIQSLEYIIY